MGEYPQRTELRQPTTTTLTLNQIVWRQRRISADKFFLPQQEERAERIDPANRYFVTDDIGGDTTILRGVGIPMTVGVSEVIRKIRTCVLDKTHVRKILLTIR